MAGTCLTQLDEFRSNRSEFTAKLAQMKQKVDDQREYHANKLQSLQDKQERDRQRSVQPLLLLLLLMLLMTVAIVVMLIVLSLLLCADFNYTVSQKKTRGLKHAARMRPAKLFCAARGHVHGL